MRIQILLLLLLGSIFCRAQGWRSLFTLPNSTGNTPKTIFETTPGNYVAISTVLDTSNGGYSNKLCVMGLNAQGQLMWTKKYGNPNLYYYDNRYITRWGYKHGNYIYYTCCAQKDTFSRTVGVLVKFNLSGDTIWQKTYRDSTEDFIPQRVTGSVDGGLLITGFFQDWTNPINPFLLFKTDMNGNEIWRRKIHKSYPDVMDGRGILQDTASKKIVAVGYKYVDNGSFIRSYENMMIFDSIGTLKNQFQYTPMGGLLNDLIQTKDKKFVAIGAKTFSVDGYGDDVTHSYAVKFDINNPATPIWGEEGNSHAYGEYDCITELQDSSFFLGGEIDTVGDHQISRIDKRDKYGSLLFSDFYDYSYVAASELNKQFFLCLNPTSDGGHVAAVLTVDENQNRLLFVKYDSFGCDSTLVYCSMVAAGVRTAKLSGSEFSIYPNPVSDILNVDLETTNGELTASFADITSRTIKQVKLGQTKNKLDLKGLSNGLYLLTITDQENKILYQTKVLKQE